MAAPTLVLAACAALGPPAAAAAVRRRAGAVELLSLSPKFDRLFPDGVVGEVALAEGRNAAEPLRWLEGPTWLEEPGGAAGDGEDVRATVLVSDVIGNRIWRWREPAFTPRARTTGGEANIFLEPSGRAQSGGTRLKEPGSNGLLWSAAHRLLFLCDHGNRRIAVARPPPASAGGFSGEWVGPTTLVSRAVVDGKARRLNSPNDLAFAPDGSLWFTDNQVDGMGDDIPPGELNRQTEAGQHFGFPWTNGRVEIPDYKNVPRPEGVSFTEPQVEMQAHAADLGMRFYEGSSFPEKYQGGIFSAQHGSWNRTTPIGARVMFTALDEEGNAAGTEVFADGWLNEETGEYRGRPMDIAFLKDGSMLVSDDFAGAIWRIAYNPAPASE